MTSVHPSHDTEELLQAIASAWENTPNCSVIRRNGRVRYVVNDNPDFYFVTEWAPRIFKVFYREAKDEEFYSAYCTHIAECLKEACPDFVPPPIREQTSPKEVLLILQETAPGFQWLINFVGWQGKSANPKVWVEICLRHEVKDHTPHTFHLETKWSREGGDSTGTTLDRSPTIEDAYQQIRARARDFDAMCPPANGFTVKERRQALITEALESGFQVKQSSVMVSGCEPKEDVFFERDGQQVDMLSYCDWNIDDRREDHLQAMRRVAANLGCERWLLADQIDRESKNS